MSGALAVAAVTACLKDLLNDGLLNHDLSSLGSFTVTATPPDRITTGANEPNQLNLFLYQVTPNLGWRNVGLPSRDLNGARITNAPLALDLHYLLTAYGSRDLNAEILLGYAMQLLHERPMLTRAQLRTVLGGISPVDGTILPSPFGTLSATDLADQVELIKISPVYLTTEELSKMWTAMQARFRTTMAYMVSVVLIQMTGGSRSNPPVLTQGKDDTGPYSVVSGVPSLRAVRSAISERIPSIRLGDDVIITGTSLNAQGTLVLIWSNTRARLQKEYPAPAASGPGEMTAHIPSVAEDAEAMHEWAIGSYTLAMRITREHLPSWPTESVSFTLSPLITIAPLTASAGDTLTVTCVPRLLDIQKADAHLMFGSVSVKPDSIATPADNKQPTTLKFKVPAVAPGDYTVRLSIDDIESVSGIVTGLPPRLTIDPTQRVKVV